MPNKFSTLKKIQLERENMHSATSKNTKAHWFLVLVVGIILLIILAMNIKLFLILRSSSSEKANILTELKGNAHQMSIFATDLTKMKGNFEMLNLKIQDINLKIKQTEEANDVQTTALENIVRAKNTLFNRINTLDIEIEQLKQSNEQFNIKTKSQ